MMAVVLSVVMAVAAGCAGGSVEDESSQSATTTTSVPTTTTPADHVCDELAGPVEVLSGTLNAFAGPDVEVVSSQEVWDRMIAQYEANAGAMTEISLAVPQLREAADEAAASFAERAAAGRATEPDLALIDRARQASRSPVDPVAVVTGLEPVLASDGPAAQVAGYVSRTCPELDPSP